MCRYRTSLLVALTLLLGSASLAHPQGIAGSFEQLRLLVRAGETVTVRDRAGNDTRGRISSLSPERLLLESGSQSREFRETDVSTIRARRSDSLSNGALWGLGVGGGIGILGVVGACNGDESCGGWAALAGLLYGGLGAGIGVGVDAAIAPSATNSSTAACERL